MSVCLLLCLPICLSASLSHARPLGRESVRLPVCPLARASGRNCVSECLCVRVPACVYVFLNVCLSDCQLACMLHCWLLAGVVVAIFPVCALFVCLLCLACRVCLSCLLCLACLLRLERLFYSVWCSCLYALSVLVPVRLSRPSIARQPRRSHAARKGRPRTQSRT